MRNLTFDQLKAEAAQLKHRGRDGVPSSSDLPRLALCHGSRKASQGLPRESTKWSGRGDVEHYMQYLGYCPLDAPDGVYYRFEKARRMVQEWIDKGYTVHSREQYHELEHLTGTPDLVLVRDDNMSHFVVLDYKFGFTEARCEDQMAGYAHIVFEKYSRAVEVITQVIQPDLPYHESKTWSREEAEHHVKAILSNEAESLSPSVSACKYCPAKGKCDATKYSYEVFAV